MMEAPIYEISIRILCLLLKDSGVIFQSFTKRWYSLCKMLEQAPMTVVVVSEEFCALMVLLGKNSNDH